MMAANPYDRRRPGRDLATDWSSMTASLAPGLSFRPPSPSPLALEDLEAMVHSAMRRARADADAPHAEQEQEARRQSWDEGYRVGTDEGRRRLMDRLERLYGERIRAVHAAGMRVLGTASGDAPSEMERALDSAVDMLAELISAHHDGFPDPEARS